MAGALTGEMHASDPRGDDAAGRRPVAGSVSAGDGRVGPDRGGEGLSPTLANIKKTHVVRLGYRESSPPFSFLDQSNRPIGYSLELCEAIVEEIGVEVDDANLKIEYVKVTSDDRIPAVVQNKIDLECGSTTANAERAKQVAFSPLMFVAGTKLMVPKASTISAPTDLKGKTVVVTKGTTNEQAMHTVDKKFSLGLNIVASPDHEQSYQMLVDGKADAFATDDILLYGLIARHKSQDKFKVTGDYLSYDPYGIMFRKGEPQLAAVVERTFRKLGSNRDLIPLYNKWFVARLPTGEKLNVAISPQLEEAFKVLDDTAGHEQLGRYAGCRQRRARAACAGPCQLGYDLRLPSQNTLSSAAPYAAWTSSGCDLPSASIITPELISRICQAPSTRTTSIDPKRMSIDFAACIAISTQACPSFALRQQNDGLRARHRDCAASSARAAGPRAGSRRERPCSRSAAMPGSTADRCSAGIAASASSSSEALAVADDRRTVLAVDDERTVVEQDHADLVLDFQVGEIARLGFGGKNLVARRASSAGSVVHLEDGDCRRCLRWA